MPGKSRHGKGKRYQINKKMNISRQNQAAAPAAVTPLSPLPAAMTPAAPAPQAAAATSKAPVNQYAYVTGDMRRIGSLTGIIIVILLVLYFFLG